MTGQALKTLRAAAVKSAGTATPEQLTVINGFALRELSPDELYVRTMYLAHNAIDRDGEIFDDALLADYARTLPGKGLFIRHPLGWDGDTGPGEGLFFAARTVTMSLDQARSELREPDLQWPVSTSHAVLLEASFFMVKTPDNTSLLAKIDAGIAGHVSIGCNYASRSPVRDGSNNIVAQRLLGPGEAYEGSLVWLGAQPGARIVKNSNRQETTTVDLKELQDKLTSTTKALETANTKAVAYDAIVTTVGDIASDPAAMKTAIDAGIAYRNDLIERTVSAKRLLGLVGDNEQHVASAKAMYAGMPLDLLKHEHDALTAKAPVGDQLTGSDPNSTGAQGRKSLRDASVTQKSLS